MEEEGVKQSQFTNRFNMLTPQNVKEVSEQIKAVNINNAVTLDGLVSQIFEKALMEPISCEMYAILCSHLAPALPVLSQYNERITFKRLLANKCQEEFEKETNARRRRLGNIRFIGELYKKAILTDRIMYECIKKLLLGLGEYKDPDEDDVESLCELMSTIGEKFDHPKTKNDMDTYFERMRLFSDNMKLSSKVRFMLKDVIDLRKNRWRKRYDAQPDSIRSAVSCKKYSRDFLLKLAEQCTDLPEGFQIDADTAEKLMSVNVSSNAHQVDQRQLKEVLDDPLDELFSRLAT